MTYFPNTPSDQAEMLRTIGVRSIDELFAAVPEEFRLRRPLNLPAAMSELELLRYMTEQAGRNQPAGQSACFLGAGCYDHFIPTAVDFLAARSEFYTAYTPYQPEASQGSLQAFFEYQTLITQLTGMEVSNASLYEGASAMAEAVLMAMAATGRQGRVVTAATVHPEYRQTLATYLANLPTEILTLPTPEGWIRPADLAAVPCSMSRPPVWCFSIRTFSAVWRRRTDWSKRPMRPAHWRWWFSIRSVWGCCVGREITGPTLPSPRANAWAFR